MTKKTLDQIKLRCEREQKVAERIMLGDRDNYDGADGARKILDLCEDIDELLKEVKPDDVTTTT